MFGLPGIIRPGLLVLLCLLATTGVLSFQPLKNFMGFKPDTVQAQSTSSSGRADTMALANEEEKMSSLYPRSSLISSFLVDISQEDGDHIWCLTPIDDVLDCDEEELSSGAKSWKALHSTTRQSSTPVLTLKSRLRGNTIEVEVSSLLEEKEQPDLVFVLTRVLAQFTVLATENSAEQKWNLVLSLGSSKEEVSDVSFSIEGARSLFKTEGAMEIVDMVDQAGSVLGMVPRSLVHTLNVLHRGIGLTVSKDDKFSELYCHRRTDFKRIFPSLYDMFVGGVSLSGEDSKLTAAREVAEELGLSGALDEDGQPNHTALSDPLFKCVVCTGYNRCVVTVFQYTIQDPAGESISWQEEEVSWGDFVPYDIVESAADLSIQRLVSQSEWPGILPAVQSQRRGSKPTNVAYAEDWMTWDFVPDGLLVWEAWLKWRQSL